MECHVILKLGGNYISYGSEKTLKQKDPKRIVQNDRFSSRVKMCITHISIHISSSSYFVPLFLETDFL